MRWTLILPVKRLPLGKSRLRPAADALVLAIALDTVAAATACGDIVVVTSDPVVRAAVTGLGASWVDDPGHGLNAAIRAGEASAGRDRPRAALLADLPALRPTDLAAALAAALAVGPTAALAGGTAGSLAGETAVRLTGETAGGPAVRAFVRDHGGTGTTLLAASAGTALAPAFGPGSAAAHAASGAVELDGPYPSLRLDVDTRADLARAVSLGLGPHTAALLHS